MTDLRMILALKLIGLALDIMPIKDPQAQQLTLAIHNVLKAGQP